MRGRDAIASHIELPPGGACSALYRASTAAYSAIKLLPPSELRSKREVLKLAYFDKIVFRSDICHQSK